MCVVGQISAYETGRPLDLQTGVGSPLDASECSIMVKYSNIIRATPINMPTLNLKPSHKSVKAYYSALDQFAKLDVTHETAVRAAFQGLLENCARQCKCTLIPEYGVSTGRGRRIVVDGALVDGFRAHAWVLGGEGHPRRSASGGGAQVCGGLPARQYPVFRRQSGRCCGRTGGWRWTRI